MPRLVVFRAFNREEATTLWPVANTALPAGLIQESTTYNFELREIGDPNTAELFIDDESLKALRNPDQTTARWEWNPGFYAGQIRVRIKYAPNAEVEIDLTVDADLAKLTRSDFDTMVRDILEDTTALFAVSGFRFGVAKGTGTTTPPMARLEFLRSRIGELERVVKDINRRPVRVLSKEEVGRPLTAAGKITGRELYRSFHKQRLQPVPPGFTVGTRQVPAIPVRFTVTAKTASTDIAENRAIKTCLGGWRSWLVSIGELFSDVVIDVDGEEQTKRQLWSRRCRALARRLNRLLELPVFLDVSDSRTQVLVSPIFTRVPQYIRFLSLYRDMSLGIAQIEGDFLNLPLSRTFELYELWVFLRFCRAAVVKFAISVEITDFFVPEQGRLGIARLVDSPSLNVMPGVVLRFKRRYHEYWNDAHRVGSFTRAMVPDISVEKANPETTVIVLDAKYRMGAQLNDAISSIHTYRDAIVREVDPEVRRVVVASYLVTPDRSDFAEDWRDAEMPARLFHPEYRRTFKFGAVTLRPGRPMTDAIQALELVLADANARN